MSLIKKTNLFIIGAAKSGTSSLCNYLGQHPDIYVSSVKEPHYFSYKEKIKNSKGPGDDMRMTGTTSTLDDYLELFKNAKDQQYLCEGSTTYLDSISASYDIKKFSPNCKILLILRNPVDRAFSSFLHLRRDGDETSIDFDDALKLEKERISKNYGLLWHYISRQYTYDKLKRYFDIFNKDQIKIYEYEYFKNNNLKVLKEIFSFLNIDNSIKIDFSNRNNVGGAPKNESIHSFLTGQNNIKNFLKLFIPKAIRRKVKKNVLEKNLYKPKLSIDKRIKLIKIYKTDILKTQDLTGLDLSQWLDLL